MNSTQDLCPWICVLSFERHPQPITTDPVDRDARIMATTVVARFNKTWINIVQNFLAIQTNCKHIQESRDNMALLKSVKSNIDGFNLPELKRRR